MNILVNSELLMFLLHDEGFFIFTKVLQCIICKHSTAVCILYSSFTCIMQYSGYIVGKRKHVNV